MNISGIFVVSIPGNEKDFVGATHLSMNGFCVDVVLVNWTKFSVIVIPENDPAFGES